MQFQNHRQRGQTVYSLHAEVECIGKGKARAPYEFGCKVSVATPVTRPRGGQFVLHSKALHGNPFDGHTLAGAIADIENNTGIEVRRTHVDKGYRGHDEPNKYRVWISGQVRRTTAALKREMKRRAAIAPIIGHLKAEHRMDRNYLKAATETASMPSSPPPDSTSTSCSGGSNASCAPGSRPFSAAPKSLRSLEPTNQGRFSQTTNFRPAIS